MLCLSQPSLRVEIAGFNGTRGNSRPTLNVSNMLRVSAGVSLILVGLDVISRSFMIYFTLKRSFERVLLVTSRVFSSINKE